MSRTGKTFLVIGGNSGIGEACAEYIEDRITRRDNMIVADINYMDVREWGDVGREIADLQPTHIVYSAGLNYLEWIGKLDENEVRGVFDVNVLGFLAVVDACRQVDSYAPSIVAITSDAAVRPMRTSIAYCASKAALDMAIRCASRELAPHGWRINGVAPGKVADTPMTEYVDARVLELRGWTAEFAEEYERKSSAIGRPVDKEEVAAVVWALLTGPAALTGEIVAVNGGR